MKQIIKILNSLENENEIHKFFGEIFTQNELDTLSKRWRIMELLAQGKTQRDISSILNVSLCKVTRGARILKDNCSITTRFLNKGIKND
jgi:TrpR family trp operon transcriptional repressor